MPKGMKGFQKKHKPFYIPKPGCVSEETKNKLRLIRTGTGMNKSEYRKRRLARIKCYHAVESGKIKKDSCIVCGSMDVYAHHEDYNKPLDIIWLCMKHHCEYHRKIGSYSTNKNNKKFGQY